MELKDKLLLSLGSNRKLSGKSKASTITLRITQEQADGLKELASSYGDTADFKVTPSIIVRTLISVLLAEGSSVTVSATGGTPSNASPKDHQDMLEPSANSIVKPEVLSTSETTSDANPLLNQILNNELSEEERLLFESLSSGSKPTGVKWSP